MDFGPFDEKNLFHIEESRIYKDLGHRLDQPTVAGDHRMRAPPAHRQAAAIQMSGSGCERRLIL